MVCNWRDLTQGVFYFLKKGREREREREKKREGGQTYRERDRVRRRRYREIETVLLGSKRHITPVLRDIHMGR